MEEAAATVGAALIAALIGSVIGGGAVARLLYRGAKDQLIEDMLKIFAKRSELDAVGGKVTGAISVATMAKDRADANADAIIRLQEADKHRWEPVALALDRLGERLDRADQRGERHAALLDEITRRLDRHDNRKRSD